MLAPSYQLIETANLLNSENGTITRTETTIEKGKRLIGIIKTINDQQYLKIKIVREATNFQIEIKYLPMATLQKAKPCHCSSIIILE